MSLGSSFTLMSTVQPPALSPLTDLGCVWGGCLVGHFQPQRNGGQAGLLLIPGGGQVLV